MIINAESIARHDDYDDDDDDDDGDDILNYSCSSYSLKLKLLKVEVTTIALFRDFIT